MSIQAKQGSVFLAALLITGTCVGTSFLTIPIMTGIAGFIPGILITCIIGLFALLNGFLYAEATLGTPDGSNLFTISRTFLGKTIAYFVSIIFILSMYAYISSYYLAGPDFLFWFCEHFFGFRLPVILGKILIALIFGGTVYCGFFFASRINFLLVVGFLAAFILTVYHGSEHLVLSHLTRVNWIYVFFAVPIVFSSFGFNALIPSICTYLKRDKKKIQQAIIVGTTLTLLIYLFWQWIMIGTIPKSPLWIAYSEGQQITQSFPWVKDYPLLVHSLNFIIFFAVVTSVICLGLALVDFYSDFVKIPVEKRRNWSRFLICLLIFIPPLFITSLVESQFIPKLIDYVIAPSGGIIINGILPIIIITKTRYYFKLSTPHFVPGKGFILFAMGLGIFFLIYLEGVMLIR